ncbi:MAG: OmpA family protein [Flavisolibacter sp.]
MRFRLLILFFLPVAAGAQNLLMNGGFEDENICTEYIKNCAPEAWISTSLWSDYYFDDAPRANQGSHFAGLMLAPAAKPRSRNFLCTRLLCGLRKGSTYLLTFYIRSSHPVFDSIGILFSAENLLFKREEILKRIPQLRLGRDANMMPIDGWQKVSLLYSADGSENFLSIGDFRQSGYDWTGQKPDLQKNFYFFIDDISLEPVNTAEKLCAEAALVKEEAYAFDARHTVLEKYLAQYKTRPPVTTVAAKTRLLVVDTLVLPDVLFATGKAELSPEMRNQLEEFSAGISPAGIDSVVVAGHTDDRGNMDQNQVLSQQRAEAVAGYFRNKWGEARCESSGYGSDRPVADNSTEEGRRKNRRVEVLVFRHD